MDTTTHRSLEDLFAQLGLPDSPAEVRLFVRRHRPLPTTLNLAEAPFWTPSQKAFLTQQWRADDGDWIMQIDLLNAMLREHPDPSELPQAEDAPTT
ncbi:DUF2789 family protein [Roseateles sp. BYS87W]|uniref:DUF2789 family protein n=1 Tax=Pelomonas baiyunensis TaxID=3299026 RepID=A0ABW7GZB4_9BURK